MNIHQRLSLIGPLAPRWKPIGWAGVGSEEPEKVKEHTKPKYHLLVILKTMLLLLLLLSSSLILVPNRVKRGKKKKKVFKSEFALGHMPNCKGPFLSTSIQFINVISGVFKAAVCCFPF